MSHAITAVIQIHLEQRTGRWVPIGQLCALLRMTSQAVRPYAQQLAELGVISSATVVDVNGREHECYGTGVLAESPVHGIAADAPSDVPIPRPQRRAEDIPGGLLHSIDL